MIRFIFLFLLLAFSSLTFAVEVQKARQIKTKRIFESAIIGPSHIVYCGKKLLVHAVAEKALVQLDLNTGSIISKFQLKSLAVPEEVVSLRCFSEKIVIARNTSSEERFIDIYKIEANNITFAQSLRAPSRSRITDVLELNKGLWVLQDNLFSTKNFKTWQRIDVPKITQLPRLNARIDLNPFDGWQDTMNIAKEVYTKGALTASGHILLLDPYHSAIALYKSSKWVRWGTWGAWEGYLMAPKYIVSFGKDNVLIVDTGLKSVFLYSYDGKYLGVLSDSKEDLLSPQYATGIEVVNRRIFISDFKASKVLAVDIDQVNPEEFNPAPLSIRKNLFRRPEVINSIEATLCLNCHDGTHSNQLFKFLETPLHHPLACAKCHEPHHTNKDIRFLQKPQNQLCISCHEKFSIKEKNHAALKNEKGFRCTDCHQSHSVHDKLLKVPKENLCLTCHEKQKFQHRSAEPIKETHRAQGIELNANDLTCATCHQTHHTERKSKFVRSDEDVTKFCASCHGQKTTVLYKDFHKLLNRKGKKK